MDVLFNIIQIYHAVQTNDFGLQPEDWKRHFPFALLKTNKICTLGSLANIETMHPGSKKLRLNKGLLVLAQLSLVIPARQQINVWNKQLI